MTSNPTFSPAVSPSVADIAALDGTALKFAPERDVLAQLIAQADIPAALRAEISTEAAALIRKIRSGAAPGMMEKFLAEYGLSTREGIALMCLAEAMLRVPDAPTIDALIEDKIAPADWGRHLGQAASSLVNASTWALMLTGKVLDDDAPGVAGVLRGAVKRLGEPVIRAAVGRAMKEMGRQFVLGQTIEQALSNARTREAIGFTYSYDMLGEAAMTGADAARYARDYERAIEAIGAVATRGSVTANPGISIKLSALHPRYEVAQEARVMAELVPVVSKLVHMAKARGIGLHVDAEEQNRLTLSFKVIDAVLSDPSLRGWDGMGIVVQAYGKRAGPAIDALYAMAQRYDQKLNVRLVKGAYWDSEMKVAQMEGHPGFPLFTAKVQTDVSYACLAQKLFGMADRIYPQFAGHNAHTVATILKLAQGRPFEFQRLHGMGEQLHDIVLKDTGGRCRIYAPVGAHRDLLAYLVRRLLENGANSSFVHQIVDESIAPEAIATDPFEALATAAAPTALRHPSDLFEPVRKNSQGFDLTDQTDLARIFAARDVVLSDAAPIVAGAASAGGQTGVTRAVVNPATGQSVAQVTDADAATVSAAIGAAVCWNAPVAERAAVLRRGADLYEDAFGPLFAALSQEAGKTLGDAVSELREACDFLRYYATEAETLDPKPLGIVAAISPWNFPLAIFTGQIAAALADGNAVIAKPAEQTPIIAAMAVRLLHQAGVPASALQLLPGDGAVVGGALTSDPRIAGVVFTGSTDTARIIRKAMADHLAPGAPLIAETGGLNAMIVDSTALPEQAVRDIVASAFRSAGQRCSALRCLYVQDDVAPKVIEMLAGAMDELRLGDPDELTTDVGPVIDADAQADILAYLAAHKGQVLHQVRAPDHGNFVPPTMVRVKDIADLGREVFGPVLHVATFRAGEIPQVVGAINATGYGLTFGLHTRIDARVQEVSQAIEAGNIYVNRNQIGAVVGSQPFGGEGLSGTGPKAGGPLYLARLAEPEAAPEFDAVGGATVTADTLEQRLASAAKGAGIAPRDMPGPTGEMDRLSFSPRSPVLCLGPGAEAEAAQVAAVIALGGAAVAAGGQVSAQDLGKLTDVSAVLWWGDGAQAKAYGQALAARTGAIVPLITAHPDQGHVLHERHLCVDTTAAGGNAALLASAH